MSTCGDFGGVTEAGTPCTRPAGWGRGTNDGVCRTHAGELPEYAQRKQDRFIACFQETGNVTKAAEVAGVDRGTHYKWLRDPEYAERFEEARKVGDTVRVALVEDSMVARIIKGDASAAETIFYLINRAPDRWRHVQHVKHEGRVGVLHVLSTLPPSEAERLAALPAADFEAEIARLAE